MYKIIRNPAAPFAEATHDLPPTASDAWWEYRRITAEVASWRAPIPAKDMAVYEMVLTAAWAAMLPEEQVAEVAQTVGDAPPVDVLPEVSAPPTRRAETQDDVDEDDEDDGVNFDVSDLEDAGDPDAT